MTLACLIGLGADAAALQRRLASLRVGPFAIEARPHSDGGFAGLQVNVNVPGGLSHAHRRRDDILALIADADLPDAARRLSAAVFTRLAEAEAKVHGTTAADVHFHEVGAVDSVVDIVGACTALCALGVDRVAVGPFPQGRGARGGAHGVMPIPAPATVELLTGFDVVQTDEPFELVTPTGAALLTTWARSLAADGPAVEGVMRASAVGIGHQKLSARPNLLRARLIESRPREAQRDECLVLECNLDDTVPELLGSLAERLMRDGALDVFTTPVHMKKQRPGCLLTVLCRPEDRDRLIDLVFAESTTFGIREYAARRTVLTRRHVAVNTPYGGVRVKVGAWKGRDITRAPEHDDCARLAAERGVPVRAVYEAALRAM